MCRVGAFVLSGSTNSSKFERSDYFNPFSPNSDQHQISSCDTNAYLTPEAMITQSYHVIYQCDLSMINDQ